MDKELSSGFKKGIGFGAGLFLMGLLFIGVTAFVEPGSGPGTNYLVDSASPIAANFSQINTMLLQIQANLTQVNSSLTTKINAINNSISPRWAGYTSTAVGGNFSGTDGMNTACNGNYTGSRAMTYYDWLKLGNIYPYTYDVWIADGSYVSNLGGTNYQITKDGQTLVGGGNAYYAMCAGWGTSSSSYWGPVLTTNGGINVNPTCDQTYRLGCVY